MTTNKRNLMKLILSAMFLALAMVLPFLTGQIPQIGKALCPMHFPILLCGFFCGPWYAMTIGFIAPLLRLMLFGMPQIFPTGIAMCFELATYGLVTGLLNGLLPKRKINVYVSLISAMLAGRVVWGAARAIMYGVAQFRFGWAAFMTGAFFEAIPGIIVQIVLIPVIVISLNKIFPNFTDRAKR